MHHTKTIQRLLASLLLVVFALSATPKVYFHEILAHHTDGPVCTDQDKSTACFHRPAFHCQFDDLVVTAPYLPQTAVFSLHCALAFQEHTVSFQPLLLAFSCKHKESRGPPAAYVLPGFSAPAPAVAQPAFFDTACFA